MPLFCYKCPKCGGRVEKFRSIQARNRRPRCHECGLLMARDVAAELFGTDTQNYSHAILSETMGVSPGQVSEHRRLHPNIPLTDTGEIIVRNGAEERRIGKALKNIFTER